MYRLGLRLTLKGGREALVRLLLTIVAVAVGVTVLLAVFADFHAYQKTNARQSWESTTAMQGSSKSTNNVELWNYSENIYKGKFIEQLNAAALGPNAPVIPGISKLPGAGQYYVSPALANLIKTVPKDELGNRFPGTQIGTIGQAGLSFPNELAIVIGYSPAKLVALPSTIKVNRIATAPQLQGTTNIYRDAFAIGAVAILFPLLILINTATRLAAARREERYAAMRLIGATPHQINVIASVDAIASSLFGAILGSLIFLAVRPAIADISFSGVKFFSNYVTPTTWAYVIMIIGVPIIAAVASLISLRRVQISPLGVSRKTTSPKPSAWRLMPLVIGVPLFVEAALRIGHSTGGSSPSAQFYNGPGPILIGFLLIMVGLVLGGSWLTMQVTKVLARFARSAPSLLAARRLSDNPKAAFRTVSGLVLAVFVGSVVSVVIPALNAAQSPAGDNSLTNVLRVPYNTNPDGRGLPAQDGSALISKLRSYPGTSVLPIYMNPAFTAFQTAQNSMQNGKPRHHFNPSANPPNANIISCSSLKLLPAIGTCAPGRTTVSTSDNLLIGDNPLFIYKSLPEVTTSSPAVPVNVKNLQLAGLLVKADNADTLEKVRTYLTTYNAAIPMSSDGIFASSLTAWQMGEFEPETVGEVAAIRNNDDTNVGRVILAMIVLTLITAGCSLAVTVGGSLIERKRPFTLLRLSGAPLSTLSKVVLLEAALPLVVVSILAAAIGLGVAIPVIRALLKNIDPNATYPVHPSVGYYIALGAGLVVSLILVLLTLPLLKRMTKPEDARFE